MAIHVWLFVTMGRTSHTPPAPPAHHHPLHFPHCAAHSPFCPCPRVPPPPTRVGVHRSPPSFPFLFCPPEGPLVADTVRVEMARMSSGPSICPTRARATRGRRGGLGSARFGSFPAVISCLRDVREGGSQVIVYTGIKENPYSQVLC